MRIRREPFMSIQDREENVSAFSCGEYLPAMLRIAMQAGPA